jgi:UDP-N-acetyl-D-glucosamine dehydrogenase
MCKDISVKGNRVKDELLTMVKSRSLKIAVIGLGYVGLPLAVEKAKAGYLTIGFDIQQEKVDSVNNGINYIGDVAGDDLKSLVDNGMLRATSDYSIVSSSDFIAICVPTPLDEHRNPDISYVKSSTEEVAKYLKPRSVVVLESTTYPGTTEELVMPILESGSGLKCGEDFFLAFSPERVDPGNLIYKTKNTPKVVGGVGADATEVAATVYESVLEGEVCRVSSPKVAEMEKLLENTYRNINIGLVNEMAIICDKMGVNVWEVIEAAGTKPYGFQAFYPGPGLGGHCIPLDPFYLRWKAREYDYHTQLIETSGIINDSMPAYVVERAGRILNASGKAMNGSKILILGVAYKQDIDDYRESPALKVVEHFDNNGAIVTYYDPFISKYKYKGDEREGLSQLTPDEVKAADVVVITTAHSEVDYDMVQRNAAHIFDTKNVMKDVKHRDNIELL